MARKPPADQDPVRRLILDRAHHLSLTLADLSRAVRRNGAYMHQYITRGSPRVLPEDVREALASVLQVPQEQLRVPSPGLPRDRSVTQPLSEPHRRASAAGPVSPRGDLPVYIDQTEISPGHAVEWTTWPARFGGMTMSFALWLTAPKGRLQAGDLAFVQSNPPPRIGDTVIALQRERIVAIGELTSIEAATLAVKETATDVSTIERTSETRLLKVSYIFLG